MRNTTPNPQPDQRATRAQRWLGVAWVGLVLIAAAGGGSAGDELSKAPAVATPPAKLSATGLYANPATHTVRADVFAFTPQYALYSDGATKRRWIYLPPGQTIDARDADTWVFPVGTRLWKEFSFERRIETRFMERQADGRWIYATYRWAEDQSDAELVGERGQRGLLVAPDQPYDLPGRYDCRACHEGRTNEVLGFSALQLATPGAAPSGDAPRDLREWVEAGWIQGLPAELVEKPPRIAAKSERERAALGYLHANCGFCHNTQGPLVGLDLDLFQSVVAPVDPVLPSLVDHPTTTRPRSAPAALRVRPGNAAESALVARMLTRDPLAMMPPLGNRKVDHAAVALLTAWIENELAPGSPPPEPSPPGSPPTAEPR